MAPAADGPAHGAPLGPDDDEDLDDGGTPRLKGLLRLVEAILFCCLSAATILWVADRSRDLGFDPIPVTICTEATCRRATTPDPWERYTALRDAPGVRTYTTQSYCAIAVGLLEDEATDPAAARVLSELQMRGVIAVSRTDDGMGLVSPGWRNDGWGDVLRDVLRLGASRGCYPSHYAPVIRPLIVAWVLVLLVRLLRNRQAIWRTR